MTPPPRRSARLSITGVGLICIFLGILILGAGLKSVGQTALDDALLYAGCLVLLPLGVALTVSGVIAVSRKKHEEALSARRGFDVVDVSEEHQPNHDD